MNRRAFLLGAAAAAASSGALAQAPFHGIPPGRILRGRFQQTRQIKGFTRPVVSSGSFVLVPGRGLIWRTEQPFAIVTAITASGLVQAVDGTETTRITAAQVPFLGRLYDVLSGALVGDWHALETQFQASRQGDAKQWELTLVPRSAGDPAAMPFRSITARGGQFVDEVRISRPNDDSDTLAFSDQDLSAGPVSDTEAGWLNEAGK